VPAHLLALLRRQHFRRQHFLDSLARAEAGFHHCQPQLIDLSLLVSDPVRIGRIRAAPIIPPPEPYIMTVPWPAAQSPGGCASGAAAARVIVANDAATRVLRSFARITSPTGDRGSIVVPDERASVDMHQ
jgi:hypothetical protein